MKKIFSKTKSILSGILIILLVCINTQGVLATDYLYQFPYDVVTNPPPPPDLTVTLDSAVPNPINWPAQNMTTLIWNVGNSQNQPADYCDGTGGTVSWPGSKDPAYGIHQELVQNLTPGIYLFEITCHKGTAVAYDSALVIVNNTSNNTPTVTLSAITPIASGASSDLSWTSNNATSCETSVGPWLNPGARPINSPSPESTGPLTANTTYSIKCTNTTSGLTAEAFTTVYIDSPLLPVISFMASPGIINSGGNSTLSWSVQNSTNCYANGGPSSWTGSKSTPNGSEPTGILTSVTTYTLTCDNNYGSTTAYATVYINSDNGDTPTIAYFQPFSCVGGGSRFGSSPRFAWNSTNANSCTITRLTAPTLNESVGVSSQVSGGSLESDGLYYYLSTLPVVGLSSNYRLQCSNSTATATEYAAVNVCSPDFTLGASPILRSFIDGPEPTTGVMGKIATYTISANPVSGFVNPIALSIQSNPPMPHGTTFTFTPDTLTNSGASYNTSTLTIWIDPAQFPAPGTTVYTPIVVQGVGGAFTRTVTIGADATGKKIMKYREPNN